MYQHLLIATDGSELAQKAVDQGLGLAKALGARALAVHVTLPGVAVGDQGIELPAEDYDKIAEESAGQILARVAEAARLIGVQCETLHVKHHFVAEGILEVAKERGVDLIIMSSHGRSGLERLLLGSKAYEVVTSSYHPVLICR